MRWLVLLLVAGCYRDASAPPANRVQGGSRASSDVLAYLPADSDVVAAFDMPQIRATATWQRYEPTLVRGVLARLTQCGIGFAALQRVTVGLHAGGRHASGVLVIRGIPRDTFMKCIVDPKVILQPISVVGDVVIATDPDSDQAAAARFVDPTTLVVHLQVGANATTLDAIVRAGVPLRGSPAFLDMFARIDTGAPVWWVAAGSSKVLDRLGRLGYPMKGAGLSIHAGDGFEVVARGRFETPAAAQQFATTTRAQLGPMQAFVDSIDIVDDDVEVKLTVKITDAQVERLVAMMGLASSLGGP